MRKFNKYIKAASLYHNPYYGKEWGQSNHKIYIDGEYQTFSQYFRNEGNYRVDIIPKYIEKSDMLVWEVSVYPLTGDLISPKEVESFETFYDAMDFVDSGELTYRLGITASRKFTKYPSNYVLASSNLASLRARAKDIATRMYKIEEQFDPFVDTYMERPSISEATKEILNDIKTGKSVDDFSYAYGVREYLKDQKQYSDNPQLIAELESVYQDLLDLMETSRL